MQKSTYAEIKDHYPRFNYTLLINKGQNIKDILICHRSG